MRPVATEISTYRGLYVGYTAKTDELPVSRIGEADSCGPKAPCVRWGLDPQREGALLWGR